MANAPRGTSVPPIRATALFARTVHRQLKQAGYGRAEMIAFINELLGQVSGEQDMEPMSAVVDVETALPNVEALIDALDFDLRRAAERRDLLSVICFDVELSDNCTDDVAADFHARVSRRLRSGLRPSDTAGRLASNRYAVALPGVGVDQSGAIAARLLGPLIHARRAEESAHVEARITLRSCVSEREDSGAALLARCLEQASQDLPPPHETSTPLRVSARRVERSSAAKAPECERVVLALGGGAARAVAHVGVLRVLAGQNISVAGVAGTSAGALVGAMTLLGMKEDEIRERFREFTQSTIYQAMRRKYLTYRRAAKVPRSMAGYFRESGLAFISNEQLAAYDDNLLEDFVAFFVGIDRDISTLSGPFAAAATDLVTGRSVRIAHGSLHHALRSSCAVPGLFLPQSDGERLLVDGSAVAEVPVRAAVGFGLAVPILAVHLSRPERTVSMFTTSSEVMLRSSTVAHKELVREQLRHAHQLITVPVEDIGWIDFRRAMETDRIGEYAAAEYFRSKANAVAKK